MGFLQTLYHNPTIAAITHTMVHELRKAIASCESVLDVGCGPSSPLQFCPWVKHSVGVEAFEPYLKDSRQRGIHSQYKSGKIEDMDFPEKSFDAVLMLEVLEHLDEETGRRVLAKAEKWARKRVVVSCPNGYLPQKELDDNPLQKHLSGWDLNAFKDMGFKCKGLAGPKCLRQEVEAETMGDDMTTTIRFKPRIFWFAVAAMSQVLVYHMPNAAFELFCVKHLGGQE